MDEDEVQLRNCKSKPKFICLEFKTVGVWECPDCGTGANSRDELELYHEVEKLRHEVKQLHAEIYKLNQTLADHHCYGCDGGDGGP